MHRIPSAVSTAGVLVGVVGSSLSLAAAGSADATVVRDERARESAIWPQFRGPAGQGHAVGTGYPLHWNSRRNVTWRTAVPGRGWSSPVVADGMIWMTSCFVSRRSLRLLGVDAATGRLRQNIEVFRLGDLGRIHPKNTHATPTPIVDGDRVYVHFGAHGTACVSTDGEIVWKRRLAYYHHHGPGASPVLHDNLLIAVCDGFDGPFYDRRQVRGVGRKQYVAALDADTGAIRWQSGRSGNAKHAYATPLVIEVEGRWQLVSPGGGRVTAYDATTGEELWWCTYDGYSVVPRPVYAGGLVLVCTGYDLSRMLAIRPTGRGDVTRTHIVWTSRKQIPLSSSPLVAGEEIYLIDDSGIASCRDLQTGTIHWRKRLGGHFSASPLLADGRIYASSEESVTTVFRASRKFEQLAVNRLAGRQFASLAAVKGTFYLRTERHLYRIEEKPAR